MLNFGLYNLLVMNTFDYFHLDFGVKLVKKQDLLSSECEESVIESFISSLLFY